MLNESTRALYMKRERERGGGNDVYLCFLFLIGSIG